MSGADTELHLPHGSHWPIFVALGITLFGVGFVVGGPALVAGLLVLVGAILGWVREDTRWWDQKVGTGESVGRLGTILFMSSEVFLFGGLFATYFSFRAASGGEWPDQHIELPLLKTLFFSVALVSSSFTLHHAERKLLRGDRRSFLAWWLVTIALGAVFLFGQALEYANLLSEGVGLSTSHFASTFFMITGTHGLHVVGGLVFLTIVFVRAMKGQFDPQRHLAPKAAGLYWHFVDAIWIIVFTVLYVIQ